MQMIQEMTKNNSSKHMMMGHMMNDPRHDRHAHGQNDEYVQRRLIYV